MSLSFTTSGDLPAISSNTNLSSPLQIGQIWKTISDLDKNIFIEQI